MTLRSIEVESSADTPAAILRLTAFCRDLLELTKPGIVGLCVVMAVVGAILTALPIDPTSLIAVLTGTGLAVGGANALNMLIERETDRLMRRTANRPLPTGRMQPSTALTFGLITGASGIVALSIGANLVAGMLAAIAFVLYVVLYTPMKQRSPWALLIGTVPGAMPPLIGWTAVSGSIELGGLLLFALLVFWQIAHFLAIAIVAKEDYRRAGIVVLPLTHGEPLARRLALTSAAILLPITYVLGTVVGATTIFLTAALLAGCAFLLYGCYTLRKDLGRRGAQQFFLSSLAYLPVVGVSLILGVLCK